MIMFLYRSVEMCIRDSYTTVYDDLATTCSLFLAVHTHPLLAFIGYISFSLFLYSSSSTSYFLLTDRRSFFIIRMVATASHHCLYALAEGWLVPRSAQESRVLKILKKLLSSAQTKW